MMKAIQSIFFIVLSIITLSLINCGGKEKIIETPNEYYMFTGERVYPYALHNLKDKLIYMFAYSPLGEHKIIAYNYDKKEIELTKKLDNFNTAGAVHSIGNYNNTIELYVLSEDSVIILDGKSLDLIKSYKIYNAKYIYSIALKNGLLFISYSDLDYTDHLLVLRREDFNYLYFSSHSAHQGIIAVYTDPSNKDQIKCANYPFYTNNPSFYEYTFDLNGRRLSVNSGTHRNEGRLIKTNDQANFLINGNYGRVFFKDDLSNDQTKLGIDLIDYQISIDGKYVYTIQDDYSINKFNTTDFHLEKSIPIKQTARNLFIDGNKLIVVSYAQQNYKKNVTLSVYEDK